MPGIRKLALSGGDTPSFPAGRLATVTMQFLWPLGNMSRPVPRDARLQLTTLQCHTVLP
jgi:hypothetical protein